MDLGHVGLGLLVDLVAIALLAYGIYYRRHGKSDLALAYTALNIGVFAAVAMLAHVEAGMGLAFGLFGILSIIRLRSTQLSQSEVAYFFVSLVLGLVNSLGTQQLLAVILFDALLLVVMQALDSRVVGRRRTQRRVVLDRAFTDTQVLRQELEYRLGAQVDSVSVEEIDFVREITVVEVSVRESQQPVSMASPMTREVETDVYATR